MRLRPGLRALRRGDGEVQVGTDPRWAVRLTGLTPDDVDTLVGLAPAWDEPWLGALADVMSVTMGSPAPLSAERTCAAVQAALLGDTPRADDVCLLAVRLTGLSAAGTGGSPQQRQELGDERGRPGDGGGRAELVLAAVGVHY